MSLKIIKNILTIVLLSLILTTSYADVYWCPAQVDFTKLKANGDYDDFWTLFETGYHYEHDPIFVNMGANYSPAQNYILCSYRNSESHGLGLRPISTKLQPVFHEGINWKWEDDSHQWATCVGTFCPSTNVS